MNDIILSPHLNPFCGASFTPPTPPPRVKSRRSQGWLYGRSKYSPLGWMFFVLCRLLRIFRVPPPTVVECSLCWVPASQTLQSIVSIQSLPMEVVLSFQWPLGPSLLLWIYEGAPFHSDPHLDLEKHFLFVPKSSGSRTTPHIAPPLGLPSLQPPALWLF